ncbi:MAG TPA: DUF6786 family protein [Puia sp.]|nr:DUF6786 family protein [Puia sp.]
MTATLKKIGWANFLWYYFLLIACGQQNDSTDKPMDSTNFKKGSYGFDRAFLKDDLGSVIELSDHSSSARVLLSSAWQGRVLTSACIDSGNSYGWINYHLIRSHKKKSQFNPIGGEERFWIGPEGGQFGFYFRKGDSFNIAHWQVPSLIDTDQFDVTGSTDSSVQFSKEGTLTNYSGTVFHFNITRSVKILNRREVEGRLLTHLPDEIRLVAYESDNAIRNTGEKDWKKESGLPSIWLLSMMTPSEQTAVCIPFEPMAESRKYITDDYFGVVPPDRLIVKDSVLFLKCDGRFRSKIGLSPVLAKPFAASYDFRRNILTILHFPVDKSSSYVNSKWEIQSEPFRGDVINAYNDGPLADGSQLGPFYEIESSSPVKQLKKGDFLVHRQIVCHLEGDYRQLRQVALNLLGVDLDEIKRSFHF